MQMWVFWGAVGGMGIVTAMAMARALWTRPADGAASDVHVYRAQLAELERDVSRSVVTPEEADRLRVEISRRMLDADRMPHRAGATGGRMTGVVAIAVAVAAGVPAYLYLGAAGYPDLPLQNRIADIERARADRPSQQDVQKSVTPVQTQTDPQYADLVRQLREAVERRPEDPAGLRLLARNEAGIGNYAAAAEAQRRLIALSSPSEAEAYVTLAELMVRAAGGYISPQAETALDAALRRNPNEPTALYLSGMMMAQGGRPDAAYRALSRALDISPDAPWRPDVLERMPEIADMAGVRWTPPQADSDAAAAISALPPDAQTDAIRGMVGGLAARLEQQGGNVDEWIRLIRAYAVLGQPDDALAAWKQARNDLAETDISTLDAAANDVGLE